jgi:hypothetical protein
MSLNLKGWKLKTLPSAHVHFLKSASLLSPIELSCPACYFRSASVYLQPKERILQQRVGRVATCRV